MPVQQQQQQQENDGEADGEAESQPPQSGHTPPFVGSSSQPPEKLELEPEEVAQIPDHGSELKKEKITNDKIFKSGIQNHRFAFIFAIFMQSNRLLFFNFNVFC